MYIRNNHYYTNIYIYLFIFAFWLQNEIHVDFLFARSFNLSTH